MCVWNVTSPPPGRLVLSRFEFEEVSSGENALEVGEDEEEVWLFWRDSNKEIRSKSIRELAQDAKEGQKEDRDVLSYYRLTAHSRAQQGCLGRLWVHRVYSGRKGPVSCTKQPSERGEKPLRSEK